MSMEKTTSIRKNKEITIGKVMIPMNRFPVVGNKVNFKEAIQEMIKWGWLIGRKSDRKLYSHGLSVFPDMYGVKDYVIKQYKI